MSSAFKIILTLLYLSLFLHANDDKNQTHTVEQNLTTQNNHYQMLQKQFEDNMSDITINEKIAKAAIRLHKYDDAFAAYDRLRILSENNQNYTIALAELYDQLKMPNQAKATLLEIKSVQPSLKSRYQILITKYFPKPANNNYFLSAQMSAGIDSNINNSAGQAILQDYFQSSSVSDAISDSFIQLGLFANDVYDIGKSSEFFWQNTLFLSSKSYLSQSAFNTLLSHINSSLGFKRNKMTLFIPFKWDYIHFGAIDLLHKLALSPRIHYRFNDSLSSFVQMKLASKQYIQSLDNGKDSKLYSLTLGGNSKFSESQKMRFSYQYLNSQKQYSDSIQSFIDYNAHIVNLRYQQKLSPFTLYGLYNLRAIFYQDSSSGTKRTDTLHDISFGVQRVLSRHMRFGCELGYANNLSNTSIYTYEKSKASCSFALHY